MTFETMRLKTQFPFPPRCSSHRASKYRGIFVTYPTSEEEIYQQEQEEEVQEFEATPSEEDSSSISPDFKNWLKGWRGLALGLGLGVFLTLMGTRFIRPESTENVTDDPVEMENQGTARSVTTVQLTPENVESLLSATGTVAAFELIPVKTQESGYKIEAVFAKEGDRVEKGELLARLDRSVLQGQYDQAQARVREAEARLSELQAGSRSEEIDQSKARLAQAEARLREAQASVPRRIEQAQAQVDSAQARLDLASNRLASNRGLLAQGAIPRDRFNEIESEYRSAQANVREAEQRLQEARNTDTPGIAQIEASVSEARANLKQMQTGSRPEVITQAQAQLAQSKAQLQTASAQLSNTQILSPVSGLILTRTARVGDVPSSMGNENLFDIVEDGRLELLLKLPETQLGQVEPGQTVLITSNRDQNLKLTGKVREISPSVEAESRQGTVKVDLPSSDSLQPGIFLRGEIITDSESGLAVPSKAVLPQSDGSAIIYTVQPDNTVKANPVEMGELLPDDKIEILSGVNAGDEIVVKGAAYLKDRDRVTVSNN